MHANKGKLKWVRFPGAIFFVFDCKSLINIGLFGIKETLVRFVCFHFIFGFGLQGAGVAAAEAAFVEVQVVVELDSVEGAGALQVVLEDDGVRGNQAVAEGVHGRAPLSFGGGGAAGAGSVDA
jgi:hypothetical protein